MRVLHLVDRLTGRGGANKDLLGVVTAQVEAGHAVWIAAGAADTGTRWPCPTRVVPGRAEAAGAQVLGWIDYARTPVAARRAAAVEDCVLLNCCKERNS